MTKPAALRDSQEKIAHPLPAAIATQVVETLQEIIGIGVPEIALDPPSRSRQHFVQR
jgi:hypothetical protein